ncbi:MAG: hypothetical protein M3328_12720, partial [Chloroflexota bacterium]|nr:hypothetical protein [Chloroflexota bacterium]
MQGTQTGGNLARVAVMGASGYIGGEALRLLLGHPCVEVAAVTSPSHAGKPVTDVLPHLSKLTDLHFTADISTEEAAGYDAIFMALPHGAAMQRVPEMLAAGGKGGPQGKGPILLDMSGDFRIKDAAQFARFYGLEHTANEIARSAAYGLTEWNREAIQ